MRDELQFFLATLVVGAVIIGGLAGASVGIERLQCHARWRDSGYAARYTVAADCQVRRPGGPWLPERTVRQVAP